MGNQAKNLGLVKVRTGKYDCLLDLIFSIPQDNLKQILDKYEKDGCFKNIELKQDSVQDQFFSVYTAEEFLMLNNSLELYIKQGGHDLDLVTDICMKLPANLVNGGV